MKKVPFFKSKKLLSVTLCTIAFVAISIVLFSCAKEELDYGKLDLIGKPKPITVSAALPESASLDKTTIGTDGKVRWESGDEITVNGTELGIREVLSAGTLAVFEGEIGAIETTYGSGYWATYPTTLATGSYAASHVGVALPVIQTFSGNNIPNYMAAFNTADGGNLSLSFKNLCCIIKIPVKAAVGKTGNAAKLKKIEITSNMNIAGEANVSFSAGGIPSMSFSSGSKTVILDCGEASLTTSAETEFLIMLPAGTHNLTVKFYDCTGKFIKKTLTNAGFDRSRIYETGIVDLNADEGFIGDFSVSPSLKVTFSLGNLQWSASGGGSTYTTHTVAGGGSAAGTWRFAEHQYDFVGNDEKGNVYANGIKCSNSRISSTYTGWIDLFGWGTSGYNSKFPYMTSLMDTDYGEGNDDIAGTYYDWGRYNQIGSYPAGTWRTLTNAEWSYMLGTTANTRGGDHPGWWIFNMVDIQINSDVVSGLFVYPDGTTGKPVGVSAVLTKNSTTSVTITKADFEILEAAGCVFLPAAGGREGIDIYGMDEADAMGIYGTCWSSSYINEQFAYGIFFRNGDEVWTGDYGIRHYGASVRLAKNIN